MVYRESEKWPPDSLVNKRFPNVTNIDFCNFFDSTVHYCDQLNNACQFRSTAVPTNLQAKYMLLTYFANYMDKHLLKVKEIAVKITIALEFIL